MKKLLIVLMTVLLGLAMTAAGQGEKAPPGDRVSGTVRSVDAKAMSIEVNLSQVPSAVKTVLWDANTKVTLVDKPGTAADIKEGMRIVAVGKFDGLKLRATGIRVRPQ
jgi:hypothetical protein